MDGKQITTQTIGGVIEPPKNNTAYAVGVNPTGNSVDCSFSDIDVYSIRIYNRGLTQEEVEVNNKADNERFKNESTIPVYTEEQLIKMGTGEQVTIQQENKTYTYNKGAKYELKNDITLNGDYTNIINKINNKEIELKSNEYKIINNGNYYTANSKYTIAVNKYGYVTNGLQLLLDAKDNTGTGQHSNTATTWKDLSGNNRDGTLQNMDISNCWKEDGLEFDGIDDYVRIAEMNYDNITLEAVTTKGKNSSQNIVSNAELGGYLLYHSSIDRFGFMVYISKNSDYTLAPQDYQGEIISNSKYSISGSYNGKTIKFRTSNGNTAIGTTTYAELITEGTIGKPLNNTYMILGSNPKGEIASGEYFNGTISSVRIYDRALTDEENAVNYLNDRNRYGV